MFAVRRRRSSKVSKMSHTNFCYWNVVFAILLKSPFYGNSRIRSINSVFTKFWAFKSVAELYESSLYVKKFLLIRIKSLWQRLIHNNTTILSSGRRLVKFFSWSPETLTQRNRMAAARFANMATGNKANHTKPQLWLVQVPLARQIPLCIIQK